MLISGQTRRTVMCLQRALGLTTDRYKYYLRKWIGKGRNMLLYRIMRNLNTNTTKRASRHQRTGTEASPLQLIISSQYSLL